VETVRTITGYYAVFGKACANDVPTGPHGIYETGVAAHSGNDEVG